MNKSQLKVLLLCIAVGLLLGTFHQQILDGFRDEDSVPEGMPSINVPEEGVTSDAFSLKLFQAALATSDKGNCCVAPACLAQMLRQLQNASAGATREQLAKISLPEPAPTAQTAAHPHLTTLYVDDSVAFTEGKQPEGVIRVPIRRDISRALILINSWETSATANEEGHLLSGEDISTATRLIAAASQDFKETWALPFHKAPALEQDFYNADGGVSATAMLQSTDTHTAATASDGSWQAAAFFFRRAGRKENPCCLIAILPGEGITAREFARALTLEKLSDIREALAKAAPRQMSVVLPSLNAVSGTQNLQPLLLELGLGKLFTTGADFSNISSEPLHLDLAVGRYSLKTSGQDSNSREPEGEVLRFNKPFIWLVGDLLSPAPPIFIGLEEQR